MVLLCLPLIFLIISHTFFAGVFTFSFDTYSCHDFLLFSLITLQALARHFLYSFMLSDVGFIRHLSIAFSQALTAFLHSLLNHGL